MRLVTAILSVAIISVTVAMYVAYSVSNRILTDIQRRSLIGLLDTKIDRIEDYVRELPEKI